MKRIRRQPPWPVVLPHQKITLLVAIAPHPVINWPFKSTIKPMPLERHRFHAGGGASLYAIARFNRAWMPVGVMT